MITTKSLSPKKSRFLRLCAVLGAFAVLPASLASAQDFEAVQKRLKKAVENGEISPAQAKIMITVLKKSAGAEKTHGKKSDALKKKSEVIKKKSEVIKKKPEAIKKKPEAIKKKPEVIKKKPEAIKKKSEAIKKKSEATKKKSEATKKKSDATKKKSDAKKIPTPDLEAAWAKLTALVKEGRITKEEASAKMAALKKRAALKKAPAGKKEAASKDGFRKKPERDHESTARKLKAAVKAGKLTPEQAKAKWAAIQKQAAVQKKAKVKK